MKETSYQNYMKKDINGNEIREIFGLSGQEELLAQKEAEQAESKRFTTDSEPYENDRDNDLAWE